MSIRPTSRIELLQGTLDLLILRTLLLGRTHGHAIAKHIERTSEDLLQVETGSLYPALPCCAQDSNFLQELEQSALVRRSLADFRRVTGLAAKLVPAALPTHLIKFGAQDIDFCRALGCSARACQACFRHQTDLLNRLDRKLKPQQNYCVAG